MSKKNNDSKNNGWSNLAAVQNDWSKSNGKRPCLNPKPKLDIQRNHLSQSSISKLGQAPTTSDAGPSGGGGTFKRNNSMPTPSKSSPLKDCDEGFVDKVQEEFEAEEAIRLVQALELQMAESQAQQNTASTYSNQPTKKLAFGNNGSSGFENPFEEELAADVVEECMLLASQEIQASQQAASASNSSFDAYAVFSKGIDAHSSVLDTGPTFKKPPFPSKTNVQRHSRLSNMQPPQNSGHSGPVQKYPKPSSVHVQSSDLHRNSNTVPPQKPAAVNPQAEAEVRRLMKEKEQLDLKLKWLTESVKTKDGEVSILRSQLKQAVIDRDQQAMRSSKCFQASETEFKDKVNELTKELNEVKLKLEFQEAEAKAAKSRNQLLMSRNTDRVKLVEPQSPGTSVPVSPRMQGPPKTPSRHKHTSSFLNRSTFEDQSCQPPSKRPRLSVQDDELERLPLPHEPVSTTYQPETRSVGEQTNLHVCDNSRGVGPVPYTLGQALSKKFTGIQLASLEFSNIEFSKNEDTCFDKKEPIPTLSLMKTGYKSRKCCDAMRPNLVNCTDSLKKLMIWDDPVADCHPTRAAILQIAEECSGILHYNLLLLQDVGRPSNKELRDREQDILIRGREIPPLRDYDLLDERQWFKEENGIEMRRCLGILSEIALVSDFAASLLTGSIEPNEAVIKRHKFLELPDYAFVEQKLPVEDGDQFYLLKVLCDICSLVLEQKLTIAFSGVVAGILSLLRNCALRNALEERSQHHFLRVIRLILVARPSPYILLSLIDLLTSVGHCQIIMRGLCTKCDDDDNDNDNVLESTSGLYTFTRDSCALQLICVQLAAVTESKRWRIVDSVSKWLVKVIAQGVATPSWILSTDSNESHTRCRVKLVTTLISLLYDTFRMLQNILDKKVISFVSLPYLNSDEDFIVESTLIRIMKRSIIILFKLIENQMITFVARVEGLYELLIQGIDRYREHLHLSPNLVRRLEEILAIERRGTASSSGEQIIADNCKLNLYLNGVTTMLELS